MIFDLMIIGGLVSMFIAICSTFLAMYHDKYKTVIASMIAIVFFLIVVFTGVFFGVMEVNEENKIIIETFDNLSCTEKQTWLIENDSRKKLIDKYIVECLEIVK